MREIARAKINLALHVRSREPDGYHRIETLFAFCEDGDLLKAVAAPDLALEVDGPMAGELAAEPDNLVLRVARLLAGGAGGKGAALRLDKRLPVASGLGGGSADAAAALRLLDKLWRLDLGEERLVRLSTELGADVPACVRSRTVRGDGRGDNLAEADVPGLSGTPVLLVNPGRTLSTPRVFAGWDGVDRGPLTDDWRAGRNDLEPAALRLVPEIADVLAALRARDGVSLARMSGSGATCFALFESETVRDAAHAAIAAVRPGWWQLATRLR